MKKSINMKGGGFQHDVCSSAWNVPKYVEWDKKSHSANVSIHIDDGILNHRVDKSTYNIAWLSESSAIIDNLISSIFYNDGIFNYVFEEFDLFLTHDERLLGKHPKVKKTINSFLPWVKERELFTKEKLVSMIASNKVMCFGHSYRQEIAKKYASNVDLFGRGFREIENKNIGLNPYAFSIAMENCQYDDYFSEKLTDCFATGTIPVYWGHPKIDKWFDTNGMIFLTDELDISNLTFDLYVSKFDSVLENYNRTLDLISAEDYIYLNCIK